MDLSCGHNHCARGSAFEAISLLPGGIASAASINIGEDAVRCYLQFVARTGDARRQLTIPQTSVMENKVVVITGK